MTTEELAAAGLPPVEPEIQDHEIAQPSEDHTSPAASGPGIREDGEIRSEGEEIGDVDADVKDLIAAKRSRPLPPSFIFGESKVTTNLIREYEAAGFFPAGSGRAPLDEQVSTPEADLIREYEAAGFFPAGSGRAPLDEQVSTPEADEVVVFRDFFTCGLRFPCDPIFPAILDTFSVKIHQLSPNSFLEVSKFL
jgi:hypothetical protein